MRTDTPHFRLTAALTTAALLLASTAMSSPVRAQQPPDQDQTGQNQADPPARVGRLARANGAVSYHAAGDTQWTPATMNFPVSAGSSFWTQPDAQAELQFSASRVALAGGSEIDIGALDNSGLRATLTQGTALLRPNDLAPGETWSVETPRGTVITDRTGRIEVTTGDTGAPTVVSVLEGQARIAGPGLDQTLTAGQAATITGTDTLQASIGPAAPDSFARADSDRDRPPLPPPAQSQSAPPPPAIASIPGGEDLAAYGAWSVAPDYGEVWYPQVEPGWAPYREGHWAFVPPWGWTWVDDAPWGFAPFHYGRWFQRDGRWGWTPGFEHERRGEYPVYAPALVAFVGIGVGVGVGWIPLGPREAYRPWYHASPRYLGAVNSGRTVFASSAGGFSNHSAATMVPAGAMTSSRPIRSLAQPIGAQTLATARPLTGQQPIRPTLATAGVTPTVARQMNLAPTGAARPAAPGPTIVPRGAGSVGAASSLPALRSPGTLAPLPRTVAPATQATVPSVQRPNTPGFAPRAVAPAPRPAAPIAPRPAPQFTAPVQHAPPVVQRPTPQFNTPPRVQAVQPRPQPSAPAPRIQAPAPRVQTPAPQARPAPPPPRPAAPAPHEKKPGER